MRARTGAPYGSAMRDAATGEVLFGAYSGRDTGRAMIGDVRSDVPGIEVWSSLPGGTDASGLLSAKGEILSAATPGTNMSIRWAGDLTTQIVGGGLTGTRGAGHADDRRLDAGQPAHRHGHASRTTARRATPRSWPTCSATGVRSCCSARPTRRALRIYTTTEVTTHKLTTLMHDVQYRAETARQQTTYNQPAYTSYYLASDIDFANVPVYDDATSRRGEPKFKDRPARRRTRCRCRRTSPASTTTSTASSSTSPNGKVTVVGEATVVAVPSPWYRLAEGATSEWTVSFDD